MFKKKAPVQQVGAVVDVEQAEELPKSKRSRSNKKQTATGKPSYSKSVKTDTADSEESGKVKHTRRRKRVMVKGTKTKANPRGGFLGSVFGDLNITKVALVVGGGALLWDYMSGGKVLGLFGPTGLLNTLIAKVTGRTGTGAVIQGTNTLVPDQNRVNPAQSPAPTPTPTPSPVSSPGTTPTPADKANTALADYLNSIKVNAGNQVTVDNTVIGGNTQRDIEQFNSNPRAQTSYLVRAAQGSPYSLSIVRAAGKKLNWDQWNWYRAQQGGTAVDLDVKGVAPRRAEEVTVDQYLSVAGVDLIETGGASAGVGSLSQDQYTGLEWLM